MKKRKRIGFRLRHLVFLLLVLYISVIMLNQRKLMGNLQSKKMELQNEIKTLNEDINELNEEIEESDSLEFVEKVAREELGMVKPREIIYVDKKKLKNSFFDIFKRDKN